MPRGVNKAIILGHIGQDPDIRHTNNSTVVCNLSVATNEEWKDKQSGEKRSRTEWHRVTAIGKLAEIMGEYLSKGQQVYIEGRLQTDKWQDTQGTDRWTTKIIASDMQMLGTRQGGGQKNNQGQNQQQSEPAPPPDFDDDIPF